MRYQRFISSNSTSFKVNDHVIECGSTIWQISNIAATWVNKRVIPFNEPEPILKTPKPKLVIPFKALLIASGAVWFVITLFFNSPILAILAALGVAIAMIYNAINDLNHANLAWESEKRGIENRWLIWDEMRNNPPVIYGLTLETNAGSKPLFYSTNEEQITRAQSAIKLSMEKKSTSEVNFTIDTLNIGGEDAINNFGSSIYQQSITEAKNGEL